MAVVAAGEWRGTNRSHMRVPVLLALTGLAFAAAAPAAVADQRLDRTWVTEDKSAHVRFEPCGDHDCGRIVWLREPIDPQTHKPARDEFNSDPSKRNQPLLGLVIVTGLHQERDGTWRGTLYNPTDGRSYGGQIKLLGPDRLQLKGCALAGLLCQSEIWHLATP